MIARNSAFQQYDGARLEKSGIWYNATTDELVQHEIVTSHKSLPKNQPEDVSIDIEITRMIHNIPKPA
jgi:hypothetical protein